MDAAARPSPSNGGQSLLCGRMARAGAGPSLATPAPRRGVTMGQLDGRCLCGSVTYTCDGEAMTTFLCHCTDCQKQTGTAFSIVVGVEREELRVRGETVATFTTVGEDTHEAVHRTFCSACGSPIA